VAVLKEVSMAAALSLSDEVRLPQMLAGLRSQVALVRALLDELDRRAQVSVRTSEAAQFAAIGGQVAEEVERLGSRMLECAAAMAG
jgi:hypothetical protein